MTMNFRFSLGARLFLWITLGLAATGQALPPPAELSGAYDCSSPGFAKQRLIFLSGGRWLKGPRFDPAVLKIRLVSGKRQLFVDGTITGRTFQHRAPALRGTFRIEKDSVILDPLPSGAEHSGLQGSVYQFRIDPATGNLAELPLSTFRPPLTCTRDGFF